MFKSQSPLPPDLTQQRVKRGCSVMHSGARPGQAGLCTSRLPVPWSGWHRGAGTHKPVPGCPNCRGHCGHRAGGEDLGAVRHLSSPEALAGISWLSPVPEGSSPRRKRSSPLLPRTSLQPPDRALMKFAEQLAVCFPQRSAAAWLSWGSQTPAPLSDTRGSDPHPTDAGFDQKHIRPPSALPSLRGCPRAQHHCPWSMGRSLQPLGTRMAPGWLGQRTSCCWRQLLALAPHPSAPWPAEEEKLRQCRRCPMLDPQRRARHH